MGIFLIASCILFDGLCCRDDKYVFACTEGRGLEWRRHQRQQGGVARSDSRDSVKSDSACERRPLTANRSLDLQLAQEAAAPAQEHPLQAASPDEDEEPESLKEQVSVDDKEKSPEVV
jgi:hypothetical protein